MSFPPCEIIKEKVFPFQVLFIMHSRTLKKLPFTNQKTRSRALFIFLCYFPLYHQFMDVIQE